MRKIREEEDGSSEILIKVAGGAMLSLQHPLA